MLDVHVFCDGVEAGAVLVDVGEVAVAEDAGIGVGLLQATEQAQKCAFLPLCTGVGSVAVLVQATLVADTQ